MKTRDKKLRPVMTRIPEGLRRRLEIAASKSQRSMNAEINARLEQSFVANEGVEEIVAKTVAAIVKKLNLAPTPHETLAQIAAEDGSPVLVRMNDSTIATFIGKTYSDQ